MTTYTLQLIPSGYKVVPEEGMTKEMDDVLYDMRDTNASSEELYSRLIKAAPPLNTPPVLRWEGGNLYVFGVWLAYYWRDSENCWPYLTNSRGSGIAGTEQEARRAAEKALGFPDGLIIPET